MDNLMMIEDDSRRINQALLHRKSVVQLQLLQIKYRSIRVHRRAKSDGASSLELSASRYN
jgi:hypothetical protein